MAEPLHVNRVLTQADRRAFLAFPYRLYSGDPNWIPRLWSDQMAWLRRRNSFFDQGDAEWFIARRNGEVVGTVGVAVDHHANHHLQRKWGVFGFLEFVEDKAVFAALVDRAQAWLWMRGMTHMLGPQSFSPNDFPGLLAGRYDVPAALYEGHSPPYYLAFAEQSGWHKYQDSLAYRYVRPPGGEDGFVPERLERLARRVARNPRYGIRHADLSHFEREFQHVLRLYNRSLSTLSGFAPITDGEFRKLVRELMPALDEEMVLFPLADGNEGGFELALPNVAEALHKSGGLRYPWQTARLWWAMGRPKSVSF